MIWSQKGYDQETIDELCRLVPALCEDSSMWGWIAFGIVVVILLALLAYFFWGMWKMTFRG
jgi:hypothetical protein